VKLERGLKMITKIIAAIGEIFGIFLIGWLARYKKYIHEQELTKWSRFTIDILFPFFIFHNIIEHFEVDRLHQLWPLPLIGLAIVLLGTLTGFLCKLGVKNKNPDFIKTFHHFCAVNNYGFLPIIIVYNLWGEVALARLFFFNLGSSIGFWTVGIALLGNVNITSAYKKIISPNIIALFFALFLSISGFNFYIPDIVIKISATVGAAAVPCILIIIGASLYPFPRMTNLRDLIYLTIIRLMLLPVLYIFLITLLPLNNDVKNIAYIVSLMPTPVMSTILTRRYGGDPEFAAQAAVLTTILSIFTVMIGLSIIPNI
jgi:predicted permease